MQEGLVKWFQNERGYGFIESQSQDFFVHYKDIQSSGFKTLNAGDKVSFDASKNEKGRVAKNVTVLV